MIDAIVTELEGDNEVERRLDTVGDLLRQRVAQVLADVGRQVSRRAEGMAPRKSGDMASTIRAKLKESANSLTETVSVQAPGIWMEFGVAEYGTKDNHAKKSMRAVYVQHGSWRVAPRPFLRPALHSVEGFVEQVLLQAVQDIMTGGHR